MIHKFRMFDTNIVVDVNSGAVHVFDDVAFELLDCYKAAEPQDIKERLSPKYSPGELEEAYAEISELEKEGLLFSEDIYETYLPLWDKRSALKSICLHIAHDCNMRCKYCFASTGDFGKGRKLMPPEIGERAIDFVIAQSGNRRNLEVDFFGGEPLLNFEAVKHIVSYARGREKEAGKNFRFTLTTNALLLNKEKLEFINKNMDNLVLSLDGRRETNDRMRTGVDGSGTYRHILTRIITAADSRKQQNYYVRGTFTRENLDFSKDVLHLADLGFRQISVEPVVAVPDTGIDIREQDVAEVCAEYEKLALEYIKRKKQGRGFNFFHFMLDLDRGPCVAKRITGCGAGHEYMAVTPEGDLYPCHQFVGIEEYKIGNVMTEGCAEDVKEAFKTSSIYTKEKCRDCWARFYCSGGCAANARQFNGDINKPYAVGCELEKKRLECALWIKARERADECLPAGQEM